MSGDEPAMPFNWLDFQPGTGEQVVREQSPGLTKREYFAAMAMQGLLSNLEAIRREGFKDAEIEEFAVMRADALIARLELRK